MWLVPTQTPCLPLESIFLPLIRVPYSFMWVLPLRIGGWHWKVCFGRWAKSCIVSTGEVYWWISSLCIGGDIQKYFFYHLDPSSRIVLHWTESIQYISPVLFKHSLKYTYKCRAYVGEAESSLFFCTPEPFCIILYWDDSLLISLPIFCDDDIKRIHNT